MNLSIVKVQAGVEITLETNTGKKPTKITLSEAQVRALMPILDAALKADKFSFRLEI